MTENTCSNEHEQANLLLPWFVNKTLDGTEMELVRRHISVCKDCQEDVSLLASVQSSMAKSSPSPILPAADSASLLASLDKLEKQSSDRANSRRRMPYVAALAAGFAAIAIIFTLMKQPENPVTRFETATSGNEVAAMDYVLTISFMDSAAPLDQERVLSDIGARDISADRQDGIYRVTVNLQIGTVEDLERYTDDLESLPPVKSVEVVAMQLPLSQPR